MAGYPGLNDIEVAWRKSGAGVCIIVEGETELEDAWFYEQWFGYRAREVTFFPQNGVEKVELAVRGLREKLGPRQVYGIVDRDFAGDPEALYPPIPDNGLFRTKKYTLENYLLKPECWFEYVRPHTRRTPKPGWKTLEETQTTIENLYRECAPLAAYNWTLRQARNQDYTAFKALPETRKTYKEHPKALANVGDVAAHLEQIQTDMGLTDLDLPQLYKNQLANLQSAPLGELEIMVSGKYVLNLLREQFPLKVSKQTWDDVLGAYIDTCPDPPEDLVELIDLILREAHS